MAIGYLYLEDRRRQNTEQQTSQSTSKQTFLYGLLVALIAIVIGIVIGFLGLKLLNMCPDEIEEPCRSNEAINHSWQYVLSQVNVSRLRENLREFASQPHIAGLERDNELVELIKNRWKEDSLDEVKTYTYEVLLSHPNPEKPNKVHLLGENGEIIFSTNHQEREFHYGKTSSSESMHAFNAYAPQGVVEGELVYVNYAQIEDFDFLKNSGINISGLICIARYGKIYRGNQVLNAQRHGAKGIVFYSDPEDVAPLGTTPEKVYPNTIFLPPTGIQRGSVFLGSGDPLTPTWPSKKGTYRINISDTVMPTIPSQPIGYGDAKHFLEILGGEPLPKDWKGGFKNLHIGPGFNTTKAAKTVRLEVFNTMKMCTVKNVVGMIKGSSEPERYVILGNHRDAWGYGAADPSSGTAQLLETVHVFSKLKHQGWRPHRSLLFASWAAEEYGIIGSQEWVEEMSVLLSSRGVAMINTDTCVTGSNLELAASPSLYSVAVKATKMVASPKNSSLTLYEDWRQLKAVTHNVQDWELISALGAGTDEAPFSFYIGIPSVDIWFQSNARQIYNTSIYPAYHTGYDTFELMDKMVDPTFEIHKACSQLAIIMLLDLSESVLLPFDMLDLAQAINRTAETLRHFDITQLKKNEINFGGLNSAVSDFLDTAFKWHDHLIKETEGICLSPLRARILNDQMMQVEKALILPSGLPGNPLNSKATGERHWELYWYSTTYYHNIGHMVSQVGLHEALDNVAISKTEDESYDMPLMPDSLHYPKFQKHIVFSPSSFDAYKGDGFSGIKELVYKLEESQLEDEQKYVSDLLKKHISDIILQLSQATYILEPV